MILDTFISPIQGELHESQGYRPPNNPGHAGVDIAGGDMGRNIVAPETGIVVYVSYGEQAGGNVLNIQHADGVQSRYDHLSQFIVSIGQWVNQGQIIGLVGATGDVTGPHLHYEIHNPVGNPIDPTPYLRPYSPIPVPTMEEAMHIFVMVDQPDNPTFWFNTDSMKASWVSSDGNLDYLIARLQEAGEKVRHVAGEKVDTNFKAMFEIIQDYVKPKKP